MSALAREKRQMRQLGIVPELKTNNGNNKVTDLKLTFLRRGV